MSLNAILIEIDLTSGTKRISDVDLYLSDAEYIVNGSGDYIVDGDGNYLTTSGTGADYYYKKCLMNAPSITRQLPNDSSGIVSERSITLQISDNQDTADDTWNDIIDAEEIRGREIMLYRYVDGGSFFSCWGIIQGYELSDYLEITVSIFDNDSFEVDLPKHTITADRFSSTALDAGNTVNIPFGHCIDIPLYNIQNDTVNDYYDYLVGYGTLEDIWEDAGNNRGVRRDGVLVNTSEYTFYDGSQGSPFSGYAFIRFTVEQKSFTGSYYALTADVKGLELGGSSAERNFANVLYHLLTNSTWGLGQSANSTLFSAAATYLSTDWLCDGCISTVRQAGDIINDLLFSCRGLLDRDMYGQRTLTIAQSGSSVSSYGDGDGTYNNVEVVRKYVPSASELPKSIKVRYGHEPGSYDYAYEIEVDAYSDFGIDVEYALPFVGDDSTAKRVLSYLRNLPVWSNVMVDIDNCSPRDFRDRKKGDIITLTNSRRNISGDWIIWELSTNNRNQYSATLRKYSANIYSQETISTPTTLVISGSPNDLNAWVGPMTVSNDNGDAASVLVKDGGVIETDANPASNGGVLITDEGIIIYRDDGSVFLKADVPGDLFTLDGTAIIGTAWIETAMIDDLQVNSAKIANLTVGTGKITDNAVSAPYYSYSNTDEAGVASGCAAGDVVLLSQAVVITQAMLDATSSGEVLIAAKALITEEAYDSAIVLAGFKLYNGTTLTDPNLNTVFYRTNDADSDFTFCNYSGSDSIQIQHTIPMSGSVVVDTARTYTVAVEWCGTSNATAIQTRLEVQVFKK